MGQVLHIEVNRVSFPLAEHLSSGERRDQDEHSRSISLFFFFLFCGVFRVVVSARKLSGKSPPLKE
jgi:hypothetical protein